VRDVAVSADNSKFASAGGDRQLFLWDVATGQTIRKFGGHDGVINSVKTSSPCIGPPGIQGLGWTDVCSCRYAASNDARPAEKRFGNFEDAYVSTSDAMVIPVIPRDIGSTKPDHPVQVAYSANNEVLATGGYDQAVKLWDTRSRSFQALQVMRPFADSVTSVTMTAE